MSHGWCLLFWEAQYIINRDKLNCGAGSSRGEAGDTADVGVQIVRRSPRHPGRDRTHEQNLENLRRNHYASIRRGSSCVTYEINVMRPQGAKRCAPSKATFPIMRSRP